jgi:hypothetical protein
MSAAYVETRASDAAAYGGLLDAIGGIATAVLAIVALAGFDPELLAGIAVIVFGGALLIQAGALLSEYAHLVWPAAAVEVTADAFSGDGLAALILVGASGIVLGILALLGIAPATLIAVAVIAFGSALMLSSTSVRKLYLLQTSRRQAGLGSESGGAFIASEVASSSGAVQFVAGLATTVMGIVAVCGAASGALTLAALLVLGVTLIMTGSTLSGLVLSVMRPARTSG